MTANATIWMALDLLQTPSSVKILRAAPLPPDVVTLLRIAAGDEEASSQAAAATRHSPKSIREAAAFYIEQILLHPEADHYRVLGVQPGASSAELRRNMALLIRWLHPDQKNGAERSVFVARVTRAWNELKNEDRRAAYDLDRRREFSRRAADRPKRHQKQTVASSRIGGQGSAIGFLKSLMTTLFGGRAL